MIMIMCNHNPPSYANPLLPPLLPPIGDKSMVKTLSAPDFSEKRQNNLLGSGDGASLGVDEKLAASVINSQHHYWSIAPSEV